MEDRIRHRNKFQQFETLPIEIKIKQLEQRLDRLENKSVLIRDATIPQNIERWFRFHRFLSVGQFSAELRYMDPTYTESAIRTTLWRMCHTGKIIRVKDGLYTEP